MPKRDEKHTPKTENKPETTADRESVDHSLYVMANELLEKSVQNDWQNVLSIGRKMTHVALGYGYFALAVTLKKLYWSLIPSLNESQARKYVLRTMWSLARAKRENDLRLLIHRNPGQYKLRKQGGTVTHLIKFHNFDPDSVVPPAHELEATVPHIAHLISQVDDETPQSRLRHTNHHDIMQAPHITLAVVSNALEK